MGLKLTGMTESQRMLLRTKAISIAAQLILAFGLSPVVGAWLPVQDEMKLMERVAQLEYELGSDGAEQQRSDAESQLIALGPAALKFLTPPDRVQGDELQRRLLRVRLALEKRQAELLAQASKVSLSGALTLQQVLAEVDRQTGNRVALAAGLPIETATTLRTLDLGHVDFWPALENICDVFGVSIETRRTGPPAMALTIPAGNPAANRDGVPPQSQSPISYVGPMRLQITRIDAVRSFLAPQANRTMCDMEIRWEPRLVPVSVRLPLDSIKAIDTNGIEHASVSHGTLSGVIEKQAAEVVLSLPLPLFDRGAAGLESLTGRLQATVAGGFMSFEFPSIAELSPGYRIQRADATVMLEGARMNEGRFEVALLLSFEQEKRALESHQDWALSNEVYLLRKDGERIEPLGMETYRQDNSGLGVIYRFPTAPRDAALIYRGPSAIVQLEIPFRFEHVRLP